MNFYAALIKELVLDSKNNFSFVENYDHTRFGKIDKPPITLKGAVRRRLEKAFESRGYVVSRREEHLEASLSKKLKVIEPYLADLDNFYTLLSNEASRKLLLQVVAFRILGLTKVKLPLSTPDFWNGIKEIEDLADKNKYLETKFMNWQLPFIDLRKKGIPVQLYFSPGGIYIDFIHKQYELRNGTGRIKAENGDYVIDAGGCWGDTALYFAGEVGEAGRVFTFEFIPSNLTILEKNLSLNPELQQRVTVLPRPVWQSTNETMYFVDNGPGSRVFTEVEETFDGKVLSLSIDDMVRENSIPRVDFIKMDIEGAEPYALKGALDTIRKFKPKLAIAIYHSLSDFVNIPKLIHGLGLGYELYLAHCSIHEEESILFAEIPTK